MIEDNDLVLFERDGYAVQRNKEESVSYDKEYWEKYIRYEGKPVAVGINKGRCQIVKDFGCKRVLDIGIGSGEFIKCMKGTKVFGYDINKYAVRWLFKKRLYLSPHIASLGDIDGITFWDSLEHIPEPSEILIKVPKDCYVFVSIPIFRNLRDIRKSKHYRPNEHYYYFTTKGLIWYMAMHDLEYIETRDFEMRAGREDIYTYVFRRK